MDELIKRQDALDALCDACTLASVKSECIFKNLESCMDHNAILDVPTIEERKTGKWKPDRDNERDWYCSECDYLGNRWFKYCPNCGADMRGEE